jgi:hypothetical protein
VLLAEDTTGDGDFDDTDEAKSGGPYASACSLATVADTFGTRDSAQADTDFDLQATCQVELDDFGGNSAFLINVCSYPSQIPNSDPSDCVVTPDSGFLTIVKSATPDDSTTFTFNLGTDQQSQDGRTSFSIDGSGSVDLISFAPGSDLDLSEVLPTNWHLDMAKTECKLSDDTSTGTLNAGTISKITIEKGRNTTCTFTNFFDSRQVCSVVADCTSDPAPGVCEERVCEGGFCDVGFQSAGTSCGDDTTGECTNPDTCDGSGQCLDNHVTNGSACGDTGDECTNADECVDGACQDNGFKDSGTACGDQSDTECSNPDTCDGSGACQDNHEAGGKMITCGDAGTECTNQDYCAGDGTCTDNGFVDAGKTCGSDGDGICDLQDECNGSGTCVDKVAPTTTSCRADAGECDVEEFCDGAGSCPANAFEPSGTACGDNSDGVCDNPDTCNANGACQDNHEPTTTACGDAEGECTNPDYCDGTGDCKDYGFKDAATTCGDDGTDCTYQDYCSGKDGSCIDKGFYDEGTACGDDASTECTEPDTCNAVGGCLPNNKVCASVTDSSLCEFDVSPKGECFDHGIGTGNACDTSNGNADCETGEVCENTSQFRILFTPDIQSGGAFKANSNNPGQTFFNLIYDGVVGSTKTLTVKIPYPYVTMGGTPVHVYDAEEVNVEPNVDAGPTCFVPPETALATGKHQISMQDWLSGGTNDTGVECDQVKDPNGIGYCTFKVDVTVPSSGKAYVNVHLDYGLSRGPHVDANLMDGNPDRYTKGDPGKFGDYDALLPGTKTVAIETCKPYTFSYAYVDANATVEYDDTVESLNEFKKRSGVFGQATGSAHGDSPQGAGTEIQLLNSSGDVVQSSVLDEDGYYFLSYKHKGKRADYNVCLRGDYGICATVTLKSNGEAEVNFDVDTDEAFVETGSGGDGGTVDSGGGGGRKK